MGISTIGKYRIEYSNQEEFNIIFEEIFLDGIYIPKINKRNKDINIVDIGSHIGLSIIYFHSLFPLANIIGYEPNPILFKTLVQNIKKNSIENVKLYNNAIDIEDRDIDFYISANDDWFSTGSPYKEQWKGKQIRKSINVKSLSIDNIFKEINEIDILKIDIEGVEHRIINQLVKYKDRINNLIIEIHPTNNNEMENTLMNISNVFKDITYIQNNKVIKSPKLTDIFIINASN